MVSNTRGALSVPCLMALFLIAITGFGVWGLLRHWRFRMETQLDLDRCVGKAAIELKSTLLQLDHSNERMRLARKAAIVGALSPEALGAIRLELDTELAFQEGLRAAWEVREASWTMGAACPERRPSSGIAPPINWKRLPPDAIGPQPFEWPFQNGKASFHLRLSHSLISSASVVQGGKNDWKAKWESALPIRPGFH